jgi:phage-related protein (TIGR01555 family)
MGRVLSIVDRLTNIMSGKGTTADRTTWAQYAYVPVSPQQAEAAYRSSWLVRKIIDIPPFDMTREWRDWQTDAKNIEALEAEERRLQIKAKCQRALVLSRLYGGGALLLGTGDSDPMQPLNVANVRKGGLTYVQVMSRYQLTESGEQRLDPADPWFGQPEYFAIQQTASRQQVQIHPSRVVAFIGQKAPEGSFWSAQSWFWGDPIMQSIGQAVKNADMAQDGFAALIDEAKVDILKIPDLMARAATPQYEEMMLKRLQAASTGKSIWRTMAIDGQEDWQQRQITWSGMPEIMTAYFNAVAGAADIPMTRLLGQSPRGLQSTGEGEERDYHSMVRARQHEMLSPALDRIDELLVPSALGSTPSDIYYEFAPLTQENDKDGATIELQLSQSLKNYSDMGIFPETALSAIAKNRIIESGRWPGSETAFEETANDPLPSEMLNEANVPPIEKQPPQPQPTKGKRPKAQ